MGRTDNKPPWASKVPKGPLEIPDPHDLVDRKFATRFIAERSRSNYDSIRQQRGKIGQQLDTALQSGKLKSSHGRFRFGDLTAWALTKTKLAGAFEGIPAFNTGNASLTLQPMQVLGFGYSLPVSLDACQDALKSAYLELNKLREENRQMQTTIDSLQPYKDKADAHSRSGSIHGKKGGRGHSK